MSAARALAALALAAAVAGSCRPAAAPPPDLGALAGVDTVPVRLAGVTRPVLAEAVEGAARLDLELPRGSLLFAFGWRRDESRSEPASEPAGEPEIQLAPVTVSVAFRPRSGAPVLLARHRLPPEGAPAESWLEVVAPVPPELGGARGSLVVETDAAPRGWTLFTAAPAALAERGDVPNLILVSLDTLRADRLGCYGHGRDTSPAIDAMARQGTLFTNAFAQSNWTLPSHYTLMTSLHPSAHGVNPDRWAFAGRRGASETFRIRGSGREETLAERLAARGLLTAAITEAGWVSARFGFSQGFASYLEHTTNLLEEGTGRLTFDWLAKHRELPFFLFVHTYQPHQPYHQPPPWDTRFVDPAHVGLALPGVPVPMEVLDRLKERSFPPTAADVEALRGLYDGEVRYVDTFVGALLEALARHGLDRETIVVVTSDHGEELFERGGFDHGPTLYDEVMRVPLVLWGPGRIPAGRQVDEPVALVDVLPTLMELVGGTADGLVQGRSLLPLVDEGAWEERMVFAEGWGDESVPFACAWDGDQKLILSGTGYETAELYDLAADPGETRDLAARRPEAVARLRRAILDWLEENRAVQEQIGVAEESLDPETRRRLEALGYL